MKKSEIIKRLTLEDASVVKLKVYDCEFLLALYGEFSPIQAIRIIGKLSPKFRFSYLPVE